MIFKVTFASITWWYPSKCTNQWTSVNFTISTANNFPFQQPVNSWLKTIFGPSTVDVKVLQIILLVSNSKILWNSQDGHLKFKINSKKQTHYSRLFSLSTTLTNFYQHKICLKYSNTSKQKKEMFLRLSDKYFPQLSSSCPQSNHKTQNFFKNYSK